MVVLPFAVSSDPTGQLVGCGGGCGYGAAGSALVQVLSSAVPRSALPTSRSLTEDPLPPTCSLPVLWVLNEAANPAGCGAWLSDLSGRLNRSVFLILLIHGSAAPQD